MTADLLPGTLDMLILQTLSHGPQHGYDIARFIRAHSQEALRVIDGALYASLHRLERRELVIAHWGRSDSGKRAKFYRLTPEGWNAFRTEAKHWYRYITAVSRVLSVPRTPAAIAEMPPEYAPIDTTTAAPPPAQPS